MSPLSPPARRRRGVARRVVPAVVAAAGLVLASAVTATAAPPPTTSATDPDVGSAVVFDPSMPVSEIQATVDAVHAQQVSDEMGSGRHAFLFLPGTYGTDAEPLQVKVGYYTEVIGLGASPGDVVINGAVEVYNQCFDDPTNPEFVGCFALNNFWRGISNLTIDVNTAGQGGCEASANFWAVSQAVSMRRVDVQGANLTLMDYCTGPSFASGGFIADSRAGVVINGSQQQWYARNSEFGTWTNAVWNQVFSGVVGAPDDSTYPDPPYTTLETTPVSREKPYLYVDDAGAWQVRVPVAKQGTRGITWADGMTAGRSIPITQFFVATPDDSVQEINNQLARGRHLLLTPGVYDVSRSIQVKRPDTVVLGIGLATLHSVGGAVPLTVADVPGVVVAGVTVDAGEVESPVLLQVGKKNTPKAARKSSGSNPTTLSDVYFRVGGPYVGKTDIALEVNSDDVLIDHTWVWRADHGIEGFDRTDGVFGDNERWRTNIGRNGVVVNGDRVTATGYFVEHFQEYNSVWNGEDGFVVLFQNELPYDPPSQAEWTQPDGTLGWAGYKVADDVERHTLWGGGVYAFNRNDPTIVTEDGYEVPETPGVVLHHIMTKNLSGPGIIAHVVNGVGGRVDGIPDPGDPDDYEDPEYVVRYPLP
ncbi:adenylyl cyclase [Aquipuribacter nitratireducens]|uniref:Adenylyl cyclase n=1 Tax=Aquipuribacter nitratireducens TaxID=650104 RepID=A0ABW0GHM4_9MICO